jgi:pimeloyl-ACP methyl ester carboxylesterase
MSRKNTLPFGLRSRDNASTDKQGELAVADRTYRIHDVPVEGGTLRVGDWGSQDPGGPDTTIIALHGISSSHLAWGLTVRALPARVRLIAPDLRGRGRSAGLPGPYGMVRHAEDLQAVIEALELPRATLIGHSMGGFVAVVAAHLFPDRVSGILLIDGGLPLPVPVGISRETLLEATLGPAARRLSMTFPDHGTYLEFWKQHPAFAVDPAVDLSSDIQEDIDESLAEYARYDLTGTEPELRPSTSLEAVKQDILDLYGAEAVRAALSNLSSPVSLITAPRGLLNETPGIYPPSEIERWRAELPALAIREVPDVNHYTIVMGAAGAADVAREVLRIVDGP